MIASEQIKRGVLDALRASLGGDQCALSDADLHLAADAVMYALRDWSMTRTTPPGTRAPADYSTITYPMAAS